MKRVANFFLIAALTICGMASGYALEMPFPTRDYPFAVKDSKLESALEYGGPVKWMDNDRVIFSAFRKDVPRSNDPDGLRIVIWDTAKDSVTPYADGKLRCYNDGRIVYLIENPKIISRTESASKDKMGEMGKEQLVESRTGDIKNLLNPFSCNSYTSLGYSTWDEIHRPNPEMRILRLHEYHGYLDLYTKQEYIPGAKFYRENDYPIKYYRPGQAPIELGIVRGGITDRPVFSKYANAYVLDQLIRNKRSEEASQPRIYPDGQRPAVRLLSPEGEIKTLTYPDALFQMTSAIGINISQKGLLISASAGDRFNPKSKTTGLFLTRNEKFVKLIDDVVHEMDVSPDGCKVAFVHGITGVGGWPIPGNSYTIKMINVCSGTN